MNAHFRTGFVVVFSGFCAAATPQIHLTSAWAQKPSHVAADTRIFHGAWFDVRYPGSFSPSPASKSKLSENGSDEATFTSPDRHVQFYVFAPQWNGNASFAVMDTLREKQVSKSSENRQNKNYTTKVRWITVEAKNKSYTRTWEDMETSLNTRHVFGVKYKSEADFKRYRPQYLAFKKSLHQFTD